MISNIVRVVIIIMEHFSDKRIKRPNKRLGSREKG